MTRAARLAVAVAAVALAAPIAWWLTRPEPQPIVATPVARGEPATPAVEAPPPSVSDEPVAAPPPRKPARRPPRFVKAPVATPTYVAKTGHELIRENPLVLDAVSGAAHRVTEAEFRAGSACIREFGRREPAAVQPDSTVRGIYVVTIETKAEQSRVVHIEGRGRADAELFDCLRKKRVWLSGQPFPAPGAPDGTIMLEWLETHIQDVLNLIKWEELTDVVLCGHSFGGCVVSGVADRIPDRVRSLVYLDAFVPEDDENQLQHLPQALAKRILDGTNSVGEGWKVPPIPAAVFNVNAADRDWVNRQCTMHPLAAMEQRLRLTGGRQNITDISFILATGWDGPSPFPPFYEKAKGWKTSTVPCGHDVMLDLPEQLTVMLVEHARQ